MPKILKLPASVFVIFLSVIVLHLVSVTTLESIVPYLFPSYFFYIAVGLIFFVIFSRLDFEILVAFSNHLYIFSIVFLLMPLIIGQVTRGTIRWIPIGDLTIQPSEIVRPFLILFMASFLAKIELDPKTLLRAFLLGIFPLFLILIQPSLGVTVLTATGFVGVYLASTVEKKYILYAAGLALISIPLFWLILAPYQKQRITSFMDPASDPQGIGYNSIQSMISVGSGGLTGRGLGKGVQTQLAFLPERHTDFIFASVSEEMGFVGSVLILVMEFAVLWGLIKLLDNAKSLQARMYISGVFLTLMAQTTIHVGMNMGIFPITGVPLPLVSAGGSSLIATMSALGIAVGSRN